MQGQSPAYPVLPYNEADGDGERDILSCSPLSAAKCHGKNPFCQGRSIAPRVEICESKYYSSLY